MPLYFIENRGQTGAPADYYVQGKDKSIYFTEQGLAFVFNGSRNDESLQPASYEMESQGWVIRLDFVGSRDGVRPEGLTQTETSVSYFKGHPSKWKTGLKTYSKIIYRDLWPGIDLIYAGTINRMKYSFVVHPGADPQHIKLAYRGASDVLVNESGELEVRNPFYSFNDERPVSFQDVDGRQVEIATAYKFEENAYTGYEPSGTAYGFSVADYDKSRELVIDPAVLIYAGFIGGSGADLGNSIATDSAGNAYITGDTTSAEATFPDGGGVGALVGSDTTFNGDIDAFVAKINATGTALDYISYIGGSGTDRGYGIAVDTNGNAYVTGHTTSTETTFPDGDGFGAVNGPDTTFNGGFGDAFVVKINATGTSLVYAGYIGGSNDDRGHGIAVDNTGNAYVTGWTTSTQTTFPDGDGFGALTGPDSTYNGGDSDAFIVKINTAGTALVFAGYVGGTDADQAFAIALDNLGNSYLAGETNSTQASFPNGNGFGALPGPDTTLNGDFDAFVAKVNAAGSALVYAGYIGGSGSEAGRGIAVDGSGSAYLTGRTASTEATFPDGDGFGGLNGPDVTCNGGFDAFVAKVNAGGTGLDYAGYIGGSGLDFGLGIAVNNGGNAFVTGYTLSSESTFPDGDGLGALTGPDTTYNGGEDAFVIKINQSGTGLDYAGYIGGSGNDTGRGITLDNSGNAYVTGSSLLSDTTFPDGDGFGSLTGPDITYNGLHDAFVVKIAESALVINDISVIEGNSGTVDAVFTVSLSSPSAQTVTVQYSTADATAAAGSDYIPVSDTLTFPPNTTTQTITVQINGDNIYELNETFLVNLSNPTNTILADTQGVCTITNDDSLPAVSIDDVSVSEGNIGITNASFSVNLSNPSSQTITVLFATANGTAISGSDFNSTSGLLTFPPNTVTRTIAVGVRGDTVFEPDETFIVNLFNSSNATLSDSQATGTILNDDCPAVTLLTKWGNFGVGNLQFNIPRGVAVDSAGNIFVADTQNNRIQKFDGNGNFLGTWGGYGSGNGKIIAPYSVAVDTAGNVYVADYGNVRIQKFDNDGNFMGIFGKGLLSRPKGVAVDAIGNVIVSDHDNNRIRKFDGNGTLLLTWGSFGEEDRQFYRPQGVATDSAGNVYVADHGNHRVQKFDGNGNFLGKWGGYGSANGQFIFPAGIAVDSSDNIYVVDLNNRTQKFDSNGNFLFKWGTPGSGNGQFSGPSGLTIDANGNAYIADTFNHRIQKFDVPPSPTANAGPDQNLETAGGAIPVTLSGSGFSPFGLPLAYEWREGSTVLGSGAMLTVNLSSGTHNIYLVVTDQCGFRGYDPIVVKIGTTTPAGSDVVAQSGQITITFTTVTSGGLTQVVARAQVPPPYSDLVSQGGNFTKAPAKALSITDTLPIGYEVIDDLDFEISTTATFSGPVTTCFYVPSVNDSAVFNNLRVFHDEGGTLVDRTILAFDSPPPNFAASTICARTSTLGRFVLASQILSLTSASFSLQQGGPSANYQIGTVFDPNQAANTLNIMVTPLEGTGVTLGTPAIAADGTITASAQADCTATDSIFELKITNNGGKMVTAILSLVIFDNLPPLIGYDPTYVVSPGNALIVVPVEGLSDDGAISSVSVQGVGGYTGSITVDGSTGVVSLTNAGPVGSFPITIRATDQCGVSTDATFMLQVLSQLEADVAPRPTGSGNVVVSDWVQVGRFSVGLDTPAAGSEFQRADCAPRNNFGDGKITVADWVQAGRYSVGLDPLTLVGGPNSPAALMFGGQLKMEARTQGRVIRAVNANFRRGQIGSMQVEFEALGNENALAFTLSYDQQLAVFLDAVSEERTKEAILVVNSKEASKGRVAIAMAMPTGKVFTAGTHNLLTLRFIPTGGEVRSSMEVRFDDSLIERELVNPDAVLLPVPEYITGQVVIEGSSTSIVSAASYEQVTVAAESIATIFGKDLAMNTEAAMTDPLPLTLAGSRVTVSDSAGTEHECRLFFSSPDQINFLIPKECVFGPATVTISGVSGVVSAGMINIVDIAPGFFTTGDGTAASTYIRGDDDNDYLILYGTGWRNLKDPGRIRILIDGIEAPVLYAGAQGYFTGLDQINILVPPEVARRNDVGIDLMANGRKTTRVKARL